MNRVTAALGSVNTGYGVAVPTAATPARPALLHPPAAAFFLGK